MKTASSMSKYRVACQFNKAAAAAFRFLIFAKANFNIFKTRKNRIEEMGEKTSFTRIVFSVQGLFSAIGFGIYGAFNAQGAIGGIIDPMGEGIISKEIMIVVGTSLSLIGMLIGHLIYEGFSTGLTIDPYTGTRQVNSKIWHSVIGLIGAVIYVSLQYYLTESAGEKSAPTEQFNGLTYMPNIIAAVALIELLIGGIILHRVFAYLVLLFLHLRFTFTKRKMNNFAEATYASFKQYVDFLDSFNAENPSSQLIQMNNENIRRAIGYYTGFQLQVYDNMNAFDDLDNYLSEDLG